MARIVVEKGLSKKEIEKIKNDPILNAHIDIFGNAYFKIFMGEYILIDPKYIDQKTSDIIEVKGENKNA